MITTIVSIASFICMAILGLLGTAMDPVKEVSGMNYFFDISSFSCIVSIAFSVILYIAAYWIMKKKIDLE